MPEKPGAILNNGAWGEKHFRLYWLTAETTDRERPYGFAIHFLPGRRVLARMRDNGRIDMFLAELSEHGIGLFSVRSFNASVFTSR